LFSCKNFNAFVFNNGQKVTFEKFSQNRSNYEFLKQFNSDNEYAPHVRIENSQTGDII